MKLLMRVQYGEHFCPNVVSCGSAPEGHFERLVDVNHTLLPAVIVRQMLSMPYGFKQWRDRIANRKQQITHGAISAMKQSFYTIDIFKNKKIGSVHLFPALKGCV